MTSRSPLAVAVVGALLIGGATTGTTLALWRDQAAVNRGALQAGSIALTVGGSTTVSLGTAAGLALGTGGNPGAPVAFSAQPEIRNASPVAAKNLRMSVDLVSVTRTSGDAALDGVLQVAASTVPTTGTCPAPTTMTFKPVGPSYGSTALTATSLAPQTGVKLCLAARLAGTATTAALGKSAGLSFTFSGGQVRP